MTNTLATLHFTPSSTQQIQTHINTTLPTDVVCSCNACHRQSSSDKYQFIPISKTCHGFRFKFRTKNEGLLVYDRDTMLRTGGVAGIRGYLKNLDVRCDCSGPAGNYLVEVGLDHKGDVDKLATTHGVSLGCSANNSECEYDSDCCSGNCEMTATGGFCKVRPDTQPIKCNHDASCTFHAHSGATEGTSFCGYWEMSDDGDYKIAHADPSHPSAHCIGQMPLFGDTVLQSRCGWDAYASGDQGNILGGATCHPLDSTWENKAQVCGPNVGDDNTLYQRNSTCCGPKGYYAGPSIEATFCCSKKQVKDEATGNYVCT